MECASLLSAPPDEALHHFWAHGAFVWNVSDFWHFSEMSEAVFARSRSFLACIEHAFHLNQSWVVWILYYYFDLGSAVWTSVVGFSYEPSLVGQDNGFLKRPMALGIRALKFAGLMQRAHLPKTSILLNMPTYY